MTCAKRVVFATLTLPDGTKFFGENWCAKPQLTCPREPGEGYDKCSTICGQDNHAEGDALDKACVAGHSIHDMEGATMHVNHKRICEECQGELDFLGIVATHD